MTTENEEMPDLKRDPFEFPEEYRKVSSASRSNRKNFTALGTELARSMKLCRYFLPFSGPPNRRASSCPLKRSVRISEGVLRIGSMRSAMWRGCQSEEETASALAD